MTVDVHPKSLLSFKAGLCACEIAGSAGPWSFDPMAGSVSSSSYRAASRKNGHARRIPLHPDLKTALSRLRAERGNPREGPVIRSERGMAMTPRSVVNWFGATYAELGL